MAASGWPPQTLGILKGKSRRAYSVEYFNRILVLEVCYCPVFGRNSSMHFNIVYYEQLQLDSK